MPTSFCHFSSQKGQERKIPTLRWWEGPSRCSSSGFPVQQVPRLLCVPGRVEQDLGSTVLSFPQRRDTSYFSFREGKWASNERHYLWRDLPDEISALVFSPCFFEKFWKEGTRLSVPCILLCVRTSGHDLTFERPSVAVSHDVRFTLWGLCRNCFTVFRHSGGCEESEASLTFSLWLIMLNSVCSSEIW